MASRPMRDKRTLAKRTVVGLVAASLASTACVVGASSAPGVAPTFKVALAQPVLQVGSTGPAVVTVQNKLGISPATGYYGVQTAAAVAAYQRAHGIPTTGVVATLTWASLGSPAPSPAPAPAPAPSAGVLPRLSYGATDPAVSTLQSRLQMPSVTGYFGDLTLAYVKALQKAAKLKRTGIVTPKVWKRVGKVKFKTPVLPPASPTVPPATAGVSVAAVPSAPVAQPSGPLASRVLAVAASLAGTPYVANGFDPEHGFNCSSYTQWVYQQLGVDLGGPYTITQYNQAQHITREQAQPGDLIFYYNYANDFIGHVGIYAGNNMMWHSPRPGRVVSLDLIYSDKVLFARVL